MRLETALEILPVVDGIQYNLRENQYLFKLFQTIPENQTLKLHVKLNIFFTCNGPFLQLVPQALILGDLRGHTEP